MNISAAHEFLCSGDYEKFPSVIFIYEDEYPVLYFSTLWQRLSQQSVLSVKNISSLIDQKDQLDAQVQTTFLGQRYTLWLGSLSEDLTDGQRAHIFSLISGYQGPHRLVLAVKSDHLPKNYMSKKNKQAAAAYGIVEISKTSITTYKKEILQFLYPELSYAVIESWVTSISKLDALIMLAQYGMVVGRKSDQFVQQWIPKILPVEASLFTLAQYFFAKKPKQFFELWHNVASLYPATFWTVYWSELLWRAYYVIVLQQKQAIADARKMAYRLPFSFIQKDWRTVSLSALRSAHSLLYDIEWRVKNGASEHHFELFFTTFFSA